LMFLNSSIIYSQLLNNEGLNAVFKLSFFILVF